jgi:molecular chaperone GrpE
MSEKKKRRDRSELKAGKQEPKPGAEQMNMEEELRGESESEHPPEEQDGSKESEQITDRIRELEEEQEELKSQLLRKQADFENFRKRLTREKEDTVKYGNSMLLLDLIEVIDDFERAIKSSEESKDFASFHSGIVLIEKQMTSLLEKKWGLCRFDSEGEVFNPEKHQAIVSEEGDGDNSVVLEDYQKGYYLYDRVLRPAKVKVSQPKSTTEPDVDRATESDISEGETDGKNNWN